MARAAPSVAMLQPGAARAAVRSAVKGLAATEPLFPEPLFPEPLFPEPLFPQPLYREPLYREPLFQAPMRRAAAADELQPARRA